MSASNLLRDTGKIDNQYLPNPYPFPATAGLGAVLTVNNSALTVTGPPTTQSIVDVATLSCADIQAPFGSILSLNSDLIQNGVTADLGILPAGNLTLKGAQTKGSFLVGDGTSTAEFAIPVAPAPVPPNGSVLILDSTQPLGVRWGGESGPIATITAGNNIDIVGTSANPIVAFQSPTTSDIVLGTTTKIVAKDNYATPNFTTEIDATGFNDTYSVGGVINQEDIAVSATDVVQTLSATQSSDYTNTAVISCNPVSVSDTRTSQILTTGFEKTATTQITCSTSGSQPVAGITCAVNAPTTSPFPDITAVIGMSCSDTTNPNISLSQSAPFAPSYTTTIDKNGITQNNSSGTGFNLQTAQDLTLTCPSANKIIVPNGNDIDLSSTTGSVVHTTTYGKDGMSSADFLAGNYASTAELTQSGGGSQMFISASNLATLSNQYLRLEASATNMNIEHNSNTVGRNLAVSSNQNLTISADNIDLSSTGRLVVPSLSSGDFMDYNTGSLKIVNDSVGGLTNPLLVLQNNTATAGAVAIETYKNDPPTATGGDVISALSSYTNALVAGVATKVEMTRISSVAQGVGTSNNDGSISLACKVNSSLAPQNFLVCNGGIGTGEIVVSKPISSATGGNLDLFCGTAGGSINLNSVSSVDISAVGDNLSLTGGTLTIITTPILEFAGAGLQSNSAGGNSGEHLVITLNGQQYKIKLELP